MKMVQPTERMAGTGGVIARLCHHLTDEAGEVMPTGETYPLPVKISPDATPGVGGLSVYSNTALAATKAVVKIGAASLYGYNIANPNAAVTYVQFFNKLTANVTVGTTVPDMVLTLPANGVLDSLGSLSIDFSIGIVIAVTTTPTGSTAAVAASNVSLFYV